MKRLSVLAVLMGIIPVQPGWAKEPVVPFENPGPSQPRGKIDELVFAKLKEKGMVPANPCSDAVFVRRAFLDVIGTLPTPQEAWQFISDSDPNKRRALIDRLLQREEYADYWALKWGDLLRVKAEFPINLWPNAVQAYHRWIRTAVKENMPYDVFVRELLTASGSNFRAPQVNFYRALQSKDPDAFARAVALTFMGARAEKWPPARVVGMGGFFSQISYKKTAEWKEEIVYFDPLKPVSAKGRPVPPAFPDGSPAVLPPDKDPREIFADWLITPKNPWFTQNIANRAWYWLLGRGIIHEPDDIRPDNPPGNPELLAFLSNELITAKYDLKHLYRLILNSATYQFSSIRPTENPDAEALFAYYTPRRLDAEVLVDAVCQITGTTEEYSSPIPEPFTFIPEDQRSISLSDGSITSTFLEMFGRPPRDTGLESERNNRPTAAQRLHLLNSSHVQRKIRNSWKIKELVQSGRDPRDGVTKLYMAVLSRPPTDRELIAIKKYADTGEAKGQEALLDLVWALINGEEFLCRH